MQPLSAAPSRWLGRTLTSTPESGSRLATSKGAGDGDASKAKDFQLNLSSVRGLHPLSPRSDFNRISNLSENGPRPTGRRSVKIAVANDADKSYVDRSALGRPHCDTAKEPASSALKE